MKYRAFISYSHAVDGALAPAVQRALQQFGTPWYKPFAFRVFRDKTGLALTPHLWASIEKALDSSDFFILLASPESAASPWVAREIEHWLSRKGASTILIVLTDGTLKWDNARNAFDPMATSALPPLLHGAFVGEPYFLDLKWARTGTQLSTNYNRFREEIADVVATLHDCPKEELIGREVVERRRFRVAVSIVLAVLILFASIAGVAACVAHKRRRTAVAQRLAAQSAAESDNAPDLSVLLAMEAMETESSPAVRASLLGSLQRHPALHTFLRGHRSPARQLFAGQGSRVAAILEDETLVLWNTLVEHSDQPRIVPLPRAARTAAFMPGWESLAAVDQSGKIWLVDAASGKVQRELQLAEAPIRLLSIDHQSGTAALGTEHGWIALYRTADWTRIRTLTNVTGTSSGTQLASITFSDDATKLAAVTSNGVVTVVRIADGQVERVVRSADGVKAGDVFFTGHDSLVFEENIVDTTLVQAPVHVARLGPTATVQKSSVAGAGSVELARDTRARLVAAGDGLGVIRLLRDDTLTPTGRTFAGHLFAITALAFSPDGRWLFSAGHDERVLMWDLAAEIPLGTKHGQTRDVLSAAASADARCVAVVAVENGVGVSDCLGRIESVLDVRDADLTAAIAPTGDAAVAGTSGLHVRARDASNTAWHQWDASDLDGARLGFSADGDMLAMARGNCLFAWNTRRRTRERSVRVCDGVPLALTVSPSGHAVAIGYDNGVTGLALRVPAGWRTRCVRTHESLVHGLAFDPSGETVAAAGMISDIDRGIRVIRLADGRRLVGPFGHHRGPIFALAFSPDGTMLLSAGADDTINLWDPTTGTPLGPTFKGQPPGTDGLSFDPEGRVLVAHADDAVTMWDVDIASWRRRACRVANRALSEAERSRYLAGAAVQAVCAPTR